MADWVTHGKAGGIPPSSAAISFVIPQWTWDFLALIRATGNMQTSPYCHAWHEGAERVRAAGGTDVDCV